MILILYAHTNSGTDVARRLLPSVGMCALDAEREVRLKAVECLKSALARLESESAKMSDDLPLSGGGVVQVFECVCWYTGVRVYVSRTHCARVHVFIFQMRIYGHIYCVYTYKCIHVYLFTFAFVWLICRYIYLCTYIYSTSVCM